MIAFEFELVQTAWGSCKQFLEGVVKIISNTTHVCAVNFWNYFDIVIRFSHVERFISITESGSNWLVNEDYVVLFGPAVVISLDIVGLHVGSSEPEGTQLKEITELTWWAGASIEPEDDWVIGDFAFGCVLPSVEHEGKDWVSFVYIQVSCFNDSIVEIRIYVEVDGSAGGGGIQ